MEKAVKKVYDCLHELTGYHRQLLEAVRLERQALLDAEVQALTTITQKKQNLIEKIRSVEDRRIQAIHELANLWERPADSLSLSEVVIEVQGSDLKGAEQLRSVHNALSLLIQRISEQNAANAKLVESSLDHIKNMKKNALGEVNRGSETYNARGKKATPNATSRIYSGEA